MELAAPITIYWDLGPEQGQVDSLCSDIIACRPLMLQIFSPVLQPEDAVCDVLERFRETSIAISLTVPAEALSTRTVALLSGFRIKELLISGDTAERLATGWNLVADHTGTKGISFQVTRKNWPELPALLGLCRQLGIKRLVLPMQRLYNHEKPFFITRQEQQHLSHLLVAAGGAEGLNLTIHDPFLWRAFYPLTPFPQAGCQAANTMLAIAPDGTVYPCPTLPVQLGDLSALSLKEIVSSTVKKDFRQQLKEIPGNCRECGEAEECRGGCRGRALVLHESHDGIDTACR